MIRHKATAALHTLLGNERRTFQSLCQEFQLVYFGHIDRHRDEDIVIRGATLSQSHRDEHFCVGTVQARDVVLLKRSDTVTSIQHPSTGLSWYVLQIDTRRHDLPHVILDGRRQPPAYYERLYTTHNRLGRVDPTSLQVAKFTQQFDTLTTPDGLGSVLSFLTPQVMSQLGHHFHQFDYEWFQDRLIIYAPNPKASNGLLRNMLQVGLWLADQLDNAPHS
jgi:hypothetical protein